MKLNTLFTRQGPGFILVRTLLVLVLISTFTTQTAFSKQAPQDTPADAAALPTWTKYTVDGPGYFLNMTDRNLAYNPLTAQPCTAYGGDALYFSCYDATNKVWTSQVVDSSIQVGQYAALAFHPNPYGYLGPFPVITYYDAYNGRLKLAYQINSVWTIEVVPDVPNVTADGKPVVPASQEGDNALALSNSRAAQEDDRLMSERLQDALSPAVTPGNAAEEAKFGFESTGYGKFSSVAIDQNGWIYITYHDEVNGSLEFQRYNGDEFLGKVIDDYSDEYDTGLWSSVAVDYNGELTSEYGFAVHIAYYDDKYDNLMYAKRKTGGGWLVEEVDVENHVGAFSSIALDSDYIPHISYFDFTTDNLKHAYRDEYGTWHRDTVDGTGIMGWFTSIAIDNGDDLHISYYNVTKGDLRYATRDHKATSWTLKTLDSTKTNNTNRGWYTSIAINPATEYPGVIYYDAGNGILKFMQRTKNGWTIEQNVNYYSRDVGIDSSLAVTPAGVPYISYLDATAGNLKWARAVGHTWYRDTVLTAPYAGFFSDIDVGPAPFHYPQIIFYDHSAADLMYGTWNSRKWSYADVDHTHSVGMYNALTVDSIGIPHMSYYDATNEDLVYGVWSLSRNGWFTQTLDIKNVKGWYTDIAVSPSNSPFISYYDQTNGALKLAYLSKLFAWTTREVDSIGLLEDEGVGLYTAIAVDSLGNPHIAYYDLTNQDLKYAYWDGVWGVSGAWNISVIDSTGDVGRFASIAINRTNNARHICYYDMTNGNLKYATATDNDVWETQVVDGAAGIDGDPIDEGDVGMYCSIDLNAAGQPAISYYDNSRGDLKLAMSYALPPVSVFLPVILNAPVSPDEP